jgi:DNA-binding CsgD family transcriptional regulator
MLSPHLSRSLGVMSRLRDLELKVASSLSALDRLSVAVLLFGARGQVTFANHAAHRILEEKDGLCLRHLAGSSSLGEVVAEDGNCHAALNSALLKTLSPDVLHTEHYSRAVGVLRPSGRQEYMVNFSALAARNEFGSGSDAPRAIAFITDSAEPIRLDAELLKKTYGLTPAELRLTDMMTECLTIEEAAQRLGLSGHTVRSQLRSIYMKTNTNNRAKLMRLIMSLSQTART